MTQIGSAFLPVHDTRSAADWYAKTFDLHPISREDHAAVLETGEPGRRLTLLGPASGIAVEPGLDWAPFNLVADDLAAVRDRLTEAGSKPGDVHGDDETCFWFTATDPDGNTLLVVDR
ncbi:VOC family protein [Myceligenerans pegani]|uniref:VOC family protein n=1 Tax=Myceligenerans pegani TaxID=2776917 RepID=A0ABR9MWU3_9MICO|nr:VOC family protein [Myceligenerans sp. TRM 65318]MBE1875394.1 VOC family protein [Myceligenerans sp. TRM 65318]MBE3017665.1 VOC family protein [Myceligenerans sp. TRM 65318]